MLMMSNGESLLFEAAEKGLIEVKDILSNLSEDFFTRQSSLGSIFCIHCTRSTYFCYDN